jgi:hypothetical protein
MFKRATAALLLTVILSSCSLWKNAPKGWSGATGGEQLEKLFWGEIKDKDWAELQKHLAPLFVATSPDGRRNRDASIERWKQFDLQSVSLSDVQVETAGPDFVVTAKATFTGTMAGKPLPAEPIQTMTVWQQVKDGWVVIAHTDSLE